MIRAYYLLGIITGLAIGLMLCRGKQAQKATPPQDEDAKWARNLDRFKGFVAEEKASQNLRR